MPLHKQSIARLATLLLLLLSLGCSAAGSTQRATPQRTGTAAEARPTLLLTTAAAQPAIPAATAAPSATPAAARSPAAAKTATPTLVEASTDAAAPAATQLPAPETGSEAGALCGFSPVTQQIIAAAGPEAWIGWVKRLSGAEPVRLGGQEVTITTRFSPALFNGQANARAFDFVLDQVRGWYPDSQIEVMPYPVVSQDGATRHTWKNLILTLPGERTPEEVVILSAHLDSTAHASPEQVAPGAEDNGSGVAALLEAARIFREFHFERTIQIIWFTGEEQGLLGSKAFVERVKDPHTIAGVVNLDMFGYDADGDRCFEIHAGSLPQSDTVGQCFVQSITAYELGLPHYDYLTSGAVRGSDHSSFWNRGIGAIEILENMFDNQLTGAGQPDACAQGDADPNYHSAKDTYEKINLDSAIRIVRAALATAAGLARPISQ